MNVKKKKSTAGERVQVRIRIKVLKKYSDENG